MSLKDFIKAKKEWRAQMARVKALPKDYQIVYEEIQKYLFKVGPIELSEGTLLSEIVDFFEEGALLGKGALEVTGEDVASFCDELIKDSKTYADIYLESANKHVNESIKKSINKMK